MVIKELYASKVLSQIMYGIELLDLNLKVKPRDSKTKIRVIDWFNKLHEDSLRDLTGALRNTKRLAVRALLGIESFEALAILRKLSFMRRYLFPDVPFGWILRAALECDTTQWSSDIKFIEKILNYPGILVQTW